MRSGSGSISYIRSFTASVCASALFVLLSACNDAPGPVGQLYLPDTVVTARFMLGRSDLKVISGIAQAYNSSGNGGTALLTGRSPDGSVAISLLGFTYVNPIAGSATAKPLQTATLKLRTYGYRFGDTVSRKASFDVVVIDLPFASNTQWSDTLVTRIDAAPVLGSFTGSFPDTSQISVTLDPVATADFLKTCFRSDTTVVNGSTTVKNVTLKSLALRPRTDATMVGSYLGTTVFGVIDSLKPVLKVTLPDTAIDIKPDVSSWIGRNSVRFGQNIIALSGGIPVRTFLQFPVDSVPGTATINQAVLRLFVDTANSVYSTSGPPSRIVGYLGTDSSLTSATGFLTSPLGYFIGFRKVSGVDKIGDAYEFPSFAPALTSWQRNQRGLGGIKNNGIILALNRLTTVATDNETTTMNTIRFFGPDAADSTKRPSISVTYTIQRSR